MEYVPSDNEIPPVSEPILREGSMEHLKSRRQKIGDFLRGTLQQAKQLPGQAVGAAEATASLGSALGLMIPSFVSGAIRQEPAGAMLERNMYIPRTESGARHLQGAAEVLKQIPDVGLLPELQPFVGISRGVGQQLQGAARRAGQAAAPVVAGAAEDVLRRQGLIMDVVKPKGGQFIGGDVPENIDKQLKSLRVTTAGGMEPAEALRQMHEQYPEHVLATMEGGGQGARRSIETLEKYSALNNWIDRNLSNYVKKEMGTPEDPVRKLAESGVTHIQERYDEPGLTTVIRRKEAGFPEQGIGQSPEARSWENLSDRSIDDYLAGTIQPQAGYVKDYEKLEQELYALTKQVRERFINDRAERLIRQGETPENAQQYIKDYVVKVNTAELIKELNDPELLKQYSTLRARTNYARSLLDAEYANILRENPWIEKLDPSTRLYTARTDNLQFDHIVDVLRDDLDSGRIRPEQLSKVSVADAVRRTYEFDQEMAKKAEQAQAELANKLLQESPFKTYDNGYTWVKLPDPAESKENMKLVQDIGCQGGWCTQNESNALYYGAHAEGNNLYVLMSPDKRVHAQIHVQSPEKPYDFDALMSNPQTKAQAAQAVREWRQRNPRVNAPLEDEQIYQALREAGIPEAPPTISEIKPRANSWQSAMVDDQIAKNPDYKPTIQRMLADFVKSTKYPVEYDLPNTGLIRFGSQYMMPDEVESIIRPQINEALNFLNTAPNLKSWREAQKKYDNFRGEVPSPEYTQLQFDAGKPISESIPYTFRELKAMLEDPGAYAARGETTYDPAFRAIEIINKYKSELPSENRASGGLVSNTDRIAAELRANGMDEEAAFNRALRLANELQMAGGGEVKLAGGGRSAGKVLGKAAESATSRAARVAELTSDSGDKALPLRLPRANLPSAVIDAEADRVARQMLGEFVRSEKKGETTNLAGRSLKEVQRLQELPYTLRETGTIAQETPYTPRVGDIKVSFPGDQTVSNRIVESVGDVPIGTESQGGGKYALGQKHLDEPEFWKSNVDPAMRVQSKVDRLSELYEPERMIGIHTAMGPTSNNFAMHLADATLRAIDWSKVKPRDINTFDRIMVEGVKNPKTKERIPFPDWPGLANPEGALEAMKKNSLMRKYFNDRMKTPKITKPLGLPNGLDIQWAMTEPDIRNMEISMTGLMAGELKPGALVEAAGAPHDTYSHRILGKALGQQEVLTPFVISFPDAAQHIMSTQRPADFTGTIQKVFPHQLVDDQYVNQYNQYRERIKKLTGKKKGGAVKVKGKVSGLSALRK